MWCRAQESRSAEVHPTSLTEERIYPLPKLVELAVPIPCRVIGQRISTQQICQKLELRFQRVFRVDHVPQSLAIEPGKQLRGKFVRLLRKFRISARHHW